MNFNEGILQDEIDAIEGQFNTSVKENYSWRIPILIRAYYKQDLNHYFSAISFGSEHRIGLYTSPLFHANLHHKREKVSGVLDTTMEEWNVLAYNLAMLYNVNKPNSVYTHDKLIFYYQRRCMGYTLALVLKSIFVKRKLMLEQLPNIQHTNSGNFLIAGPCAIEGTEMALEIAKHIKKVCNRLEMPFILKALTEKPIAPVWIPLPE